MTRFGFHASHEQMAPSALLAAVVEAEAAGFTDAMCSDHLAPWGEAQGHSGFAWAWLGAALQATDLPFGVVNAPGQRYHPAIIAQAAATLAEMYPGRFWLAVGSGEALNEHVTGDRWPSKADRNQRLVECAEVMRALWRGEEVTHDGLVTVDRARVWSLPEEPPLLVGAAVSPTTARWLGGWADGLVTINQPMEALRAVVDAFREGGGEGKPVRLQVHLAYADDEEAAAAIAHQQWRTNVFDPPIPWDLELVEHFDAVARTVRPADVARSVQVSSDPARHAAWLAEAAELDFEVIYLHHVGQDQRRFLEVFGEQVLPRLADGSSRPIVSTAAASGGDRP
jgi:probable non-F420 flavinoid oxidoreductase